MREILALSVLIVVAVALWRARTALTHNNLCSLAQLLRLDLIRTHHPRILEGETGQVVAR
jgi:hypothetical protein